MYFSFSYSPPSTSYTTQPMDIPSSSSGSSSTRPISPCAYPCWPRRSSLDSTHSSSPSISTNDQLNDTPLATSYLSDDDLFPDVFEESPSSNTSSPSITISDCDTSPFISPMQNLSAIVDPSENDFAAGIAMVGRDVRREVREQQMERVVDPVRLMREVVREEMERRREKRERRERKRKAGERKARGAAGGMSTIAEAGE